MPELPELEALRIRVTPRLLGQPVTDVSVHRPLVWRTLLPPPVDASVLVGRRVTGLGRHGKFLLFWFDDLALVTNFMLAGNLTWLSTAQPPRRRDYYTVSFPHLAMRYADPRGMGKTYLADDLAAIPGLDLNTPDGLSPDLTRDLFLDRLRSQTGEIKGVLTRERVVLGVGNAYADEILWAAGIYPFAKARTLSREQRERLYDSLRQVLTERVAYLLDQWPPDMDLHWRQGLQVHLRGGLPCPRCGAAISEITVGKRPTSYCRNCQPGLLVRN
ncbi:MAG: Fpg/Nei family DNA glycosylase [Anaerolineae bacterium]|jgi:formamidopyrimidine-DNA glycosylase|nr:Fpg/Nei family DNA glycosylase [Chloroflexota bacterium]